MTKLIKLDQSDKNIIDYIKQARIKKNITQKQLAEMSGISLSVIGTTETYKQKYSYSTIKKLFKALELEPTKEMNAIEKISLMEIDLFPETPPKYKIKLPISDRFIDNDKDLDFLQLKNKGNLIIDERQFFEPFREDFKINSQNYYAIIINDDSLIPTTFNGDYLIIKYLDNFNYANFLIKEERAGTPIPKMYVLAKHSNIVVRYIKIIHNSSYDKNLFYAFLYLSEIYDTDKYARLVSADFYFKEGEFKIIGEVIASIRPKPTVISFNN